MGRRLGLVVGVNAYGDNTFQSLRFAENDARAFAQWLVNEKGGKWGPADVQHVYGIHATKELVQSLVLQLCLTVAQPDDLVLIYIASHAYIDERSGEGYLALADTSYVNPATGLPLAALAQKVMTQSRAASIVFILDSFQTGRMWGTRQASPYDMQPLLGPAMLAGLQQQPNRVVVGSCRGNAVGAEVGERGLGALMFNMIIGLSGGAADPATGNVSLQTLYGYLSHTLGMQQRPQVFGHAPEPLVLVGDAPLQQQVGIVPQPAKTPVYATSVPQTPQGAVQQSSYGATATAQLSPSHQMQRTTSGPIHVTELEQHRQQQTTMLLNAAMQQFQAQHVDEAMRLTDQALHITPTSSSGLTLKSQILGTMGRFPEALAVVEQLRQLEPENALAWSMGAVLLTNMGRHQEALGAIERSLELDASNAESYAIKTHIMSSIAITQNQQDEGLSQKNELIASDKRRSDPLSFLMGMGLQFVGMVLGIVGGLVPLVSPKLPIAVALLLESVGLTILCVNAARGAYRRGFSWVLVTVFFSLIPAAILGISLGYRSAYRKIFSELQAHTTFLLPLLFLGFWLVAAAVLPVLVAIVAFISGMVTGARRRR